MKPFRPRIDGKNGGAAAVARSRTGMLRRLFRDSRGVTGLEFALIAPIFLVLVLAVLENGLTLWQQSVLDNATRDAARLTLTGQAQNGGTSFATQLCNEIGGLMSCNSLQYRIQTGSTFAGISPTLRGTGTTLTGFSAYPAAVSGGSAGADVLVQVVYNRTYIIPFVGQMFSATGSERLVATAAFQTEPF